MAKFIIKNTALTKPNSSEILVIDGTAPVYSEPQLLIGIEQMGVVLVGTLDGSTSIADAIIEVSNDGTNWVENGTAETIDESTPTIALVLDPVLYQYGRVKITQDTGDVDVEVQIVLTTNRS